jgi:hypothetical protein
MPSRNLGLLYYFHVVSLKNILFCYVTPFSVEKFAPTSSTLWDSMTDDEKGHLITSRPAHIKKRNLGNTSRSALKAACSVHPFPIEESALKFYVNINVKLSLFLINWATRLEDM